MPNPKVALLAGTTGLVGNLLLEELLAAPEYSRVYALSRRPVQREHPRLANRVVRFEQLAAELKGLVADDAFCCLGTTIAKAGSEAEFHKTDVDLVLSFARVAQAAKVSRFVVVTSAGADPAAKNFYLRTKGELEAALPAVGFQSLDIMQPGPLLGWRREMRPKDLALSMFTPLVNPFLFGSREIYRGVSAKIVARAMLGATRTGRRGTYRYTYRGLRQLAELQPKVEYRAK
ncbi:MAG TPA: NAD(P)H-binding protein [Steroidobacteraceae bacterium]|nr:NAD(P)H-binding protein [Steroidobacteraceae bacterium]